MDLKHPKWCQPRCCRAVVGGTHKSDRVEATYGTSRASAGLQQQPEDEIFPALVTAHHAIGAPVVFLPLAKARALLDETSRLVEQACDGETG